MENNTKIKYFAFISYSSKDAKWGKRLHCKLEGYRMPATLCSERGWKRKPMKPVFFAPTDIQPGGLTAELQERLRSSRHLIVIGSPNSAQSEWVGKEIEFFHQLGRTDNIHYFIVDGQPNSNDPKTECYHPILKQLGIPEILGANIHEKIYRWPWLNKQRAYVQLITKLLGVEFDTIWQRHKRQMRLRAASVAIFSIAVVSALAATWQLNQPFDAELSLNEATLPNDNLPPLKDAVVTLNLDNEIKKCTIPSLQSKDVLTNIPHRFLGKNVHVTVSCEDYLPVDTVIVLNRQQAIDIRRDEKVYGSVQFLLWNVEKEKYYPNIEVTVAGIPAISDSEGRVRIHIPLTKQRTRYPVSASIPLLDDSIDAETTENTSIQVK